MTLAVPERRRSQRVDAGSSSWLAVPSTWRVDLLDVSLGGMSFTSQYRMEPGRTASVRTTLGGAAFNGEIRVCWSRPRSASAVKGVSGLFEVGAVFLPLEESCRRVLESFLRQSRLSRE